MKNLIFVIVSLISAPSFAGYHGVETGSFLCADGKTYDVATYYSGGYGSSLRTFLGLCSEGTMGEDSFYGWFSPEDVPEVQVCQEDSSPEIEKCLDEFKQLNRLDVEGVFYNREVVEDVSKIIQSPENSNGTHENQ